MKINFVSSDKTFVDINIDAFSRELSTSGERNVNLCFGLTNGIRGVKRERIVRINAVRFSRACLFEQISIVYRRANTFTEPVVILEHRVCTKLRIPVPELSRPSVRFANVFVLSKLSEATGDGRRQ